MAINNWRYIVTWGYMDPNGNIVEETQWVPNEGNWRYVVTWGYMDPDWNIVEETQWVPDNWENTVVSPSNTISPSTPSWVSNPTISSMFSMPETLKFQADWYYNQWNTNLWDAYSALWKDSSAFSNTANQINSFYNQLGSDVYQREMWLAWAKQDLANKLYSDMDWQRQYVMDTFWPEGSLTKEINNYYWDLSNYLSSEAGREAARIAAQWVHSWASLWAIRAQQNEAYNQAYERYIKAKEQELNAKQTIAANLINYMSTLRKEYWDTTNTYIIWQYQRANDLLNSLSQSIASTNAELATSKLSTSLSKSSSSSNNNDITWWLWDMALKMKQAWYTDEQIYKATEIDLRDSTPNTTDDSEWPYVVNNN